MKELYSGRKHLRTKGKSEEYTRIGK